MCGLITNISCTLPIQQILELIHKNIRQSNLSSLVTPPQYVTSATLFTTGVVTAAEFGASLSLPTYLQS